MASHGLDGDAWRALAVTQEPEHYLGGLISGREVCVSMRPDGEVGCVRGLCRRNREDVR